MKNLIKSGIFLLLMFFVVSGYCFPQNDYDPRNSVIKIYVDDYSYSYGIPWQNLPPSSSSGSGVVIEGNKILTNAHNVTNATFIQVKKFNDSKKYIAKIEFIADECDLALLSVIDNKFFEGIKPLELSEVPYLQEQIFVMGYPIGGEEISITKGVVSRIEYQTYSHSFFSLMACQIDAAINPGNSGGPVMLGDKMVGIAFQSDLYAENTGYFIPEPVIRHFFEDIKDGTYNGFPFLAIQTQNLENEDLRRYYKCGDDDYGMLVNYIADISPLKNILKVEDVIIEIDGIPISNDGTVIFRPTERINYNYIIDKKHIGDECRIKVIRDGKKTDLKFKLTLNGSDAFIMYSDEYNTEPRYFVFAGFVFQALTINYLRTYGNYWYYESPKSLLGYAGAYKSDTLNEVVIINTILKDEINQGYDDFGYGSYIIKSVNKKRIKSLDDLILLVEKEKSDFIIFEDFSNNKIILDRKNAIERNGEILKNYNVTSDRSKVFKKN
jgi:S1-C subfamily serine protease